MPYSAIADLPEAVKARYSARCQRVFMDAFNDHDGDEESRFAVAHSAATNCQSAGKALLPLKATVIDDDAFRLLAIPFGGPIPSKATPLGVDLDGEWFSARTDIKPDWFPVRMVDWHHGRDPMLGRNVIGKATDLEEEDDGWWVKVWLNKQSQHLQLIDRLSRAGAQLYGSSESLKGHVVKAATGEILRWPYMLQTITLTPINTWSVPRPLKGLLDDYAAEGIVPTASFFDDLARYVDDLATRPSPDPTGDGDAKAGRVLAARNEARLREGVAEMAEAGWNPVRRAAALARFREVLDELDRYLPVET